MQNCPEAWFCQYGFTAYCDGCSGCRSFILSMAGLSFLGLGPSRPTAEWGATMSEAKTFIQQAPWCIVFPGLALLVTVVIFNLLGDALRDVIDEG